MSFSVSWAISSAIAFLVGWGVIALDGVLNKFLKGAEFHWWYFISTRHSITILYLNGSKWWPVALGVAALVSGFLAVLRVRNRAR